MFETRCRWIFGWLHHLDAQLHDLPNTFEQVGAIVVPVRKRAASHFFTLPDCNLTTVHFFDVNHLPRNPREQNTFQRNEEILCSVCFQNRSVKSYFRYVKMPLYWLCIHGRHLRFLGYQGSRYSILSKYSRKILLLPETQRLICTTSLTLNYQSTT